MSRQDDFNIEFIVAAYSQLQHQKVRNQSICVATLAAWIYDDMTKPERKSFEKGLNKILKKMDSGELKT